ncbi:Putative regulatory protein OS=Streptomyces griseus subsp. griseus (strain JCM 4626 / NBRC)OX=455632 GN=SGR_734 PE=4 SV=1 [Streptomyces griseus subsp. griseus]
MIGDVSGHGAAEAALGVCLRVAWRTAVLCGTSQPEQIALLEEILVAERSDSHVFATVTSLVFPPGQRHAQVLRAGHPGLLLREGKDVSWVEPEGGMALGLLPGFGRWPTVDIPLAPGAGLVLFTDGLFEGRDGPDSRLGEEGLLAMARANGHLPARSFVDALVAGAAEGAAPYGGLADDVAVLHLGWGSESDER